MSSGRLVPGPGSLAPTGDLPPFLPSGWQAVPTPMAGGGQMLVLRQRVGRRRAAAAGIGAIAIVVWAYVADLALNDPLSQDRPWIWILGFGALGATWFAVRRARIAEAWQLTPGCLLIGEIRVRSGAWLRPPWRAAALEVDGYTLSAVIPNGGTSFRTPMHEGAYDDGSVQALGAWLAARADIPFTDQP